jgi:F-type H+-transporting ATPase subunit b
MIDERERMIKGSIDQAEKTRAEAEALLKQQRDMLEKTRVETAQMLETGRQEAEKTKSELIEQAKTLQQEIIVQGKIKIQQETRSAVEEIKTKAADLAIAAAGRLIEVSLDERSRKKLVEEYIEELSRKKLS